MDVSMSCRSWDIRNAPCLSHCQDHGGSVDVTMADVILARDARLCEDFANAAKYSWLNPSMDIDMTGICQISTDRWSARQITVGPLPADHQYLHASSLPPDVAVKA